MKLRHTLPMLALLVSACASAPRQSGQTCVAIGPAGQACLLPPAALPAVDARHIVNIIHDGQRDTMIGRLQVDAEALRLAGASLFGTHLFTITWDGTAITSVPSQAALPPQLVVAMLEAALADPAALRPRLHGITLAITHDGDTEIRTLTEHGHRVARIEQTGTPLAAAHLLIRIPPAKLELKLAPIKDAP